MSNLDKKSITNDEEQYLKDMKNNRIVFEQKLQKLKKRAQELQKREKDKLKNKFKPLNRTAEIKYSNLEKSKTIDTTQKISDNNSNNKNISKNNTIKNFSHQESKEIKSTINPDYSLNNDTNTSFNNMYYTLDDDFFNDKNIKKDNKIKELIKKNKQLKNEIEYKDTIIESLEKQIELLKEKKDLNDNNNIITQNKFDEINFELGKLTRELEEKNQKIENNEINNKNLNIKIDNLVMQNKNLSNREKKIIEKNEYLINNIDKIKDDNDNHKKKNNEIRKIKSKFIKRL